MAWLVRWAAELLSKYSCGDDGKSPHERLHGERCGTPLVPFGESIMYLPMKTTRRDKGNIAKRPGIWLGVIARTQEVLVGTEAGVATCRTVTRLLDDEKWNARQVLRMRGRPWEPVHGRAERKILVAIDSNGNGVQVEDDEHKEQTQQEHTDDEGTDVQFKRGIDKFHVSKKAIDRYGPTAGCPACATIKQKGITIGRVGANHNDTCRKRVTAEMRKDPLYRRLMQKHDGGISAVQGEHNLEEQKGHIRKAIHVVQRDVNRRISNITDQLDQAMMSRLVASMDVAEFYSPPRVAAMAAKMGLRAARSLGMTTRDADGRAWDFNIPEMRKRAARRVLEDKPILLIGSHMCTVYSTMNHINHAEMAPEVVQARFEHASKHLEFATTFYKIQVQGGRHFIHERPEGASSWQEVCIMKVMAMKDVKKVVADQCRYGLRSKGENGFGPARKAIGFMNNSPCIAMQMQRRCPNRNCYQVHKHVQLNGGRAKVAQLYPPGLCRAICKGLVDQMEADRNGQYLLMSMDYDESLSSKELLNASKQAQQQYKTIEEEQDEELDVVWDDVSGAILDPKEVRRAREEEIKYVRDMGLHEKVPINECYMETGKAPISIRSIVINNGDESNPILPVQIGSPRNQHPQERRSRRGTPHLEALKLILSMVTIGN